MFNLATAERDRVWLPLGVSVGPLGSEARGCTPRLSPPGGRTDLLASDFLLG